MKRHSLQVAKRTVTGRKVKKIRREGLLPANIYGKDIASVAVQVPLKEFQHVFKLTGETGLIDLALESEIRPVLIHNVQLDYITQEPIHADFYQVNLKEKIKTMIPVVLTGEAKAVAEKLGLLLQTLNEVEVEALPGDLPEKFEVSIITLAAVNDQVTVANIAPVSGVAILTDNGQVIAKISELVSQEAQEQAAQEAAAKVEAKAEGAEGEATTSATTPAPESAGKTEEKK